MRAAVIEKDESEKKDVTNDDIPLLFITATDLARVTGTDPVSRRLVRAHARRAAHYNKGSLTKLSPVASASEQPLSSRFKLSSWQRRNSRKKLPAEVTSTKLTYQMSLHHLGDEPFSPSLTLTTQVTPLNVLPIPITPTTHGLLQFYHLEFRANSFALNPEGNWYTFVRVHPAAFHAFLSAIAILRSFQLGIPDMVSVLNHRNEAVRLINKDLADNTSLSDQLITAVSSLVVAEAVENNFERASMHMRGLATMVQLRGGLDSFEAQRTLQRVISWADFCFASTWCLPLSFPPLQSLSLPAVPAIPFAFKSVTRRSNGSQSDIVGPDKSVIGALAMVRSISYAISTSPRNAVDRVAISNSIYVAEYELLSLKLPFPFPDGGRGQIIDISEGIRLATLLFLHLAIRELPPNAERDRRIIDTLFYSLPCEKDLSIMTAPETSLYLLLWAFIVGIVSATIPNPTQHALLVRRICELTKALGLDNYTKFIQTLKKVLWIDSFCENRCVALWNEISQVCMTGHKINRAYVV